MRKNKRKINVKLITAVLSFALLFAGTLGSSLAWLLAKSEVITNTFTSSDINITLTETTGEGERKFQMVPGYTIDKNPTVTVDADSEDCYVFVIIEEIYNGTSTKTDLTTQGPETENGEKILYAPAEGWTLLPSASDENTEVYYRTVMKNAADREFPVLGKGTRLIPVTVGNTMYQFTYTWGENQVLANPKMTQADMPSPAETASAPRLTFTAYATQYWKGNTAADGSKQNFEPEDAWAIAQTATDS